MNTEFPAICYGIKDYNGASCNVIPRGGNLEAQIDGLLIASLVYRETEVSLTGVDDRYLCFVSEIDGKLARLLVPDKSIIETMVSIGASGPFLKQLRLITEKQTRRSVGRWSVFGGLVVGVLALALLGWVGFRFAVERGVEMIPPQWEVELGRSAAADILSETPICTDQKLNLAVQEIGTRLVGGLGATSYAFKLRVLDSEEVNAFALPGGYIFINRGLIEQAEDGEEVAGVLAHEIQHVLGRHGISNVARQAGIFITLAFLVGDMGGIEGFLIENAASLAAMSFSRDQEAEADSGGLKLMYRASLDASGLPRFLQKLADEEGVLGELFTIVSTHPASADRVEQLITEIKSNPQSKVVPLVNDWTAIKGLCDPLTVNDPDAI
jgi:Peptidase family M48